MADDAFTATTPDGREVRLPDERTYYINIPIHPLTGQVISLLKLINLYFKYHHISSDDLHISV